MSSRNSLSILPHHDGSELYLSSSSPKLGQRVTFKFRAGSNFPIEQAILRLYHDGEPRFFPMKRSLIKGEQWWQVKVEIRNLKTPYRFLIVNGDNYSWLNARGFQSHDVTSTNDFQLLATPAFPNWIRSAVFYQIFPDRFATSGQYQHLKPEKFISRPWDQLPNGRDKSTGVEFFGGDLDGVSQRLDHLKELGINGIYFTPIFPAGSTHRYDASSFDEVDPLLGGDAALLRLAKKAKSAGIYLMGDLTTNHCGREHSWLQRSLKSKKAKEREFFYWDKSVKHGYEGWWGLASLPKLNYNSKKLREIMYQGKNSIVKKWLKKPYNLAGWRIDVGNMTGRYKGEDINHEVITGVRKALQDSNSQAWLVAENADHFPSDLDGFGWHGTMNYNGFMRPIWGWLSNKAQVEKAFFGVPVSIPRFTAGEMVSAMKEFSATIPWRNFVSSMLLLDSHDTARFRNVVGTDPMRHIAGMGLLLTYPGVPSIYAGDELGLEGQWGEDGRRTIDWSRQSWDHDFLSEVKKLIKIRRQSHALAQGGLRWILIEDDLLAFERESKREKILVVVSRAAQKVKIEGITEVKQRLYGPELKGQIYKSDAASLGIYRLSYSRSQR
jgi:alpha-glucosidase